MGKGCKILHEDCDPTKGQDRSLPYNSFLIEYSVEGLSKFDIASGAGQVDIFDDYWDKYGNNFRTMKPTEGRINPKNWDPPGASDKKKK